MASNSKNLAELLNTDTTVNVTDVADGSITSAKLDTNIDVAGTLDVTGNLTADSRYRFGGQTVHGGTQPQMYHETSDYMVMTGGTNGTMFRSQAAALGTVVGDDGKISIGTAAQPEKLNIHTGDIRLIGGSDNRIQFFNSGVAYNIGSSGGAAIRFHRPTSGHEGIEFEVHDTGVHHKQAMKIHPEGYITKNNTHPMCSCTGGPNIRAITGTGTQDTVIVYGTAYVNNGGHYNTGTGIFTCPVAGWYRVQQHCMVDTAGVTQALYITLNVNGGGYIGSYTANTSYNMNMSSMVYYCNANDQIAAMVRHGGKHTGYDSFNVELIG